MIIREGGTSQTNIQLKPELLAADLWVAGWGGIIQTAIRARLSQVIQHAHLQVKQNFDKLNQAQAPAQLTN